MSQSAVSLAAVPTGRARGLTRSVLGGLFWTLVGTGGQAVLRLVVLVLLARLLSPADFGVVSAALVVVGLSTIFSQLGVGPAVVQRPDLDERHLRAGFTLSILFGISTSGVLWLSTPVIAAFFRMAGIAPVMHWLSLLFVLQSLSVVAESLQQRGLHFRRIAVIDLVAFGAGYGLVGVALALMRMGVWALVGAQLAQVALKTGITLAVQPHPKRFLLARRPVGDLLYFGGGHTAARVGNYAASQADNLIVGRWLGAVALGIYGRAYQLMAAPAMFVGEILDRVLFPAMVRVQGEPERLASAYVRSVALIALMMLPASAVFVVLAPELVRVLLGPAWGGAVVPFQIFACGLLFRTSYKMSDALVRATGAVYRRAWRQVAFAVLVAAGAWIGRPWGLVGVSVGVLIAIAANFALMWHLSMSLTGITWRALWTAHRTALALTLVLGLESWGLAVWLRGLGLGSFPVLAGALAVLGMTVALLLRFAPGLALGEDGAWMMSTLAAYLAARNAPEGPAIVVAGVPAAETAPAPPAVARPGPPQPGIQRPIAELALRLDAEGIRYCHFKSNQHLEEALCGITDLDVLVERSSTPSLHRILAETGFKRFAPPPGGGYYAVEDYLCMDEQTGRLLHLHLHHQLTTGERHLKGYRFPWEGLILSTRRRDERFGFWVADPNLEFLLLMVRGTVKLRQRDLLLAPWKRGWLRGELRVEYLWLKERLQLERLEELACTVLGRRAAQALLALAGEFTLGRLLVLRRRTARQLRLYRTYSAPGALLRRLWREQLLVRVALRRRSAGSSDAVSRTDPRGGVLVALLGPDGSGKSTLTAHLVKWLCWKLDARVGYFGSGDGPSSLLRWPLKALLGVMRRTGARPLGDGVTSLEGAAGTRRRASRLEPIARAVWALVLSFEKQRRLTWAWRARNRGIVILCDRYPQNQVMGFSDGPLLHRWAGSPSRLLRALARWESVPYRNVGACPPDVVIRLRVSPEVARRRKPEMRSEEIARRQEAIASLHFPPGTRVVEIDADRPWEAVLLDCKRAVWEAL